MSLLVVGTVALDSVETPDASRERVLGGSAVYFSYAASYFTSVRMVGVVGEDWPSEHTELLRARRIDLSGLKTLAGRQTFHWRVKYRPNMDARDTVDLQLNAYGETCPELSEPSRRCPFLFLANGSPTTQIAVLEQMIGPRLVVADTMEVWIQHHREELLELLQRLDGLILNDREARLLTGERNTVCAGNVIREMGPTFVVVKKGEHGVVFFSKHETYVLPAFPTEHVNDPTGAGDSFAGAMMGYLAEQQSYEPKALKEAMAYGILAASFTVEDFSLDRLRNIERDDIELRMERYRRMLSF